MTVSEPPDDDVTERWDAKGWRSWELTPMIANATERSISAHEGCPFPAGVSLDGRNTSDKSTVRMFHVKHCGSDAVSEPPDDDATNRGDSKGWRSGDFTPTVADATKRSIGCSRRLPVFRWSVPGRSEHL